MPFLPSQLGLVYYLQKIKQTKKRYHIQHRKLLNVIRLKYTKSLRRKISLFIQTMSCGQGRHQVAGLFSLWAPQVEYDLPGHDRSPTCSQPSQPLSITPRNCESSSTPAAILTKAFSEESWVGMKIQIITQLQLLCCAGRGQILDLSGSQYNHEEMQLGGHIQVIHRTN